MTKVSLSSSGEMTRVWSLFRAVMPITSRWAYFDHAAVAPLPEPTAEAIHSWCRQAASEGDTVWPEWSRGVERTRSVAAALIAAHPDEVALVPSTTAGISLVAEGFPWKAGDNVVTLANEFPSNLYPWMNLADRGVETRRVPVSADGKVNIDELLAACDGHTRIVSVSWVGYASGYRLDIATVAEAVHESGALLFLDAIQGLGVFPLDVTQIPVDFLAADGHKWMLGPEGAGIFYTRREHLDLLRPIGVGWNSVEHCYDFSNVEFDLKKSAGRYEGGTMNMAGFLGLGASLELLSKHQLTSQRSAIAERILKIADYAGDRLLEVGAEIVSPLDERHRSGIVSFRLSGKNHDTVRRQCLNGGVVLSHRNACLRISPHAYNNEQDVDRLIEVLRQPGSDA